MKYPEFQQIIDTMEKAGYDYKKELKVIDKNIIKRNNGGLSLSDHVKAMVYAMLSNNRPWKTIENNIDKINKIFYDFDIEELKKVDSKELVEKLTSPELHCGNRQIKQQMKNLRNNIETLEKIAADNNSVDEYIKITPRDFLIKSLSSYGQRYKLKYMGVPLVCEYLKGVGVDVVKPDVHVCRLIKRLGYVKGKYTNVWEVIDICGKIAEEYDVSQAFVDTVLWQYCAKDKFECCTSQDRKCMKCCVSNCPSRQ